MHVYLYLYSHLALWTQQARHGGGVCLYTEVTCSDSPCKNGGKCIEAARNCNLDNVDCGFTCECVPPHTGTQCNVYQRCYSETRLCYMTDYQRANYRTATDVCLRHGNLTKPIILSQMDADNLRTFIEQDPAKTLNNDSVWLAATARRLSDTRTVYLQWLDGIVTSTVSTYCSIALYHPLSSLCLSVCLFSVHCHHYHRLCSHSFCS